jgi:hypothetical protein
VAGGASVRRHDNGFFIANLDTYGGNSGSAVFNEKTGEVEGILVRGETDFIYKGSCRVSNVCTDTGCRGEDVTRMSELLSLLPREGSRSTSLHERLQRRRLEQLARVSAQRRR